MRKPRARLTAAITAAATAALTATGIGVLAVPAQAASSGVVINEVYGGGGNSGATYKNDFIELGNRAAAAKAVDGWSVQYISAGATGSWQVTALSGSVGAGGLYLIGEAAGTGGTTDLPATQASGSIAMSATAGTVALVANSTALTCKTAADCAADPDVVDLVGYGTAVINEGSADAPAPSNTTSDQRTAAADSDQNGTDFATGAPTPGADNSGSPGGGGGTPGPLQVHDIQGSSWLSPQAGSTVTNVPGVVTGIRSAGSGKGYWIQDTTPDNDPATSEGIFVFTGSAPTVSPGDDVLVSGKVQDFYPLSSGDTVATTSNLSVTEIDQTGVITQSAGNPLPAPVVLAPDTVPGTYAPDLGGTNIESTRIQPDRSALDFYESVEGMRVAVDNARVVGPSDSFAEQYITTKPDQDRSYRGGTLLTAENATPSGRLEVVAANGSNPRVNVGDVFTGATTGPLDYSRFGGYLIAATTLGTVQRNNLAPVVAAGPASRQLSIATYNVENLAPSDPASKFQALANGIVTNLASPDIIALEEVQDNDGATDDGVVAADQTIARLTAAITAAGGPSYDSREIDPVNDTDGGQPGGNIRVAFLFNPAQVSFTDAGSPGVNRSTTGTQLTIQKDEPALTLSPGRIDPTNPVWTASRKPLVGEFSFRGKDVFVIANHFDSKLGDQNADGRFQFPAQSSAVQRAGQALVEHDFINQILAIDKKADVVVVGDLNDYQFSPALSVLRTGTADGSGTPTLTDLITTLPASQQYTYDFDGISEVLDHILVTRHISTYTYQVVHVNSEYASQVSDHDPQVVDVTP
ncbi:MAG TPA: endonuclease/exonuclease/phosphatase family protein [Streptosporangiaceae bacterium]|nr:endonuclease/exonuclease/phosphatase family protein [Streptosporangiaceae bacterium]